METEGYWPIIKKTNSRYELEKIKLQLESIMISVDRLLEDGMESGT